MHKQNLLQAQAYRVSVGGQLKQPIRIAFLSDLHGEQYGHKQHELLLAIRAFAPDLVLFGGDTFDERVGWDGALDALQVCANEWLTFYTPGNHEMKIVHGKTFRRLARQTGANLLSGESALLTIRNDRLLLCGVEDPLHKKHDAQLQAAKETARSVQAPSLLITHRPERVSEYSDGVFDLVLTGHAHGGQWRFPFLQNGFYAPDAGLFPTYTGGVYRLGRTQMLVSRGLARKNTRIPRIGNAPELVLLTLY